MNLKTVFFALTVVLFLQNSYSQNTETRIIGDFSKIDVWGNIKIGLQKGDTNSIFVVTDSVSLNEIITEANKGVLKIKMRSNLFKDVTINLKITYKEIDEIKANASAELKFSNPMVVEKLAVESIGGARVILDVNTENLDLTAYQGGHIDIKGKTKHTNIFANSGGILSATHLIADEADIKLNTGGKAEITVVKKIKARVNTKSSLSYFGKPEIEEIKTSLGANVSKWDE